MEYIFTKLWLFKWIKVITKLIIKNIMPINIILKNIFYYFLKWLVFKIYFKA